MQAPNAREPRDQWFDTTHGVILVDIEAQDVAWLSSDNPLDLDRWL